MLSVEQARRIVLDATTPLPTEEVALHEALDRVLAEDVRAIYDAPRFANSAMDGFALKAGPAGRTLQLVGESRAGAPSDATVQDGQAIRISTGAALPQGADAVVMVERTRQPDGDASVLVEAETTPGQNLRHPGEDLREGETVLEAGTTLGPAEVGVAATAGVATVTCRRRPHVVVLSTGDELVAPGEPLGPGQVHDSNALTLMGLARRAGATASRTKPVEDTLEATIAALTEALQHADVLISSGGVSVGPHDHVKPALEQAGVQERFWRVALRPGKPTWFGTRDQQLAFGLPGNPVSSVVTFLLFARPALRALQGGDPRPETGTARLTQAVPRNPGRDECVRVTLDGDQATLTGPQGSHVLTSMLGADALAVIPAGEGELAAGSAVAIERLP